MGRGATGEAGRREQNEIRKGRPRKLGAAAGTAISERKEQPADDSTTEQQHGRSTAAAQQQRSSSAAPGKEQRTPAAAPARAGPSRRVALSSRARSTTRPRLPSHASNANSGGRRHRPACFPRHGRKGESARSPKRGGRPFFSVVSWRSRRQKHRPRQGPGGEQCAVCPFDALDGWVGSPFRRARSGKLTTRGSPRLPTAGGCNGR